MKNYPQILSALRSPQIKKSVSLCVICGLLLCLLSGCQVIDGFRRFDTASYTTRPGIDYACPHDGKHGDEVTITVEHNGKKASQTVASASLLEKETDFVGEVAISVFNDTR